jgi:hypothetical protein
LIKRLLTVAPAQSIHYFWVMHTVEEIEQAAERLAQSDFDRLALWVSTRYHEIWKQQMERDAAEGKLDFLFNKVAVGDQNLLKSQ